MAYYPKSQVKTNLYTNGGEYTTTSNQFSTVAESYIGYYYKTSTGQLYTGKNPQEKPSLLLYTFEPLLSNIEVGAETETLPTNLIITNILEPKYSYNSAISSPTRSIPQFSLTLPTKKLLNSINLSSLKVSRGILKSSSSFVFFIGLIEV